MKKLTIVVDFDGTCTTHAFPKIGKEIGAIRVLKLLINKGHKLVLFTMRSDSPHVKADPNNPEIIPYPGQYLSDAINWFNENKIPLYGIQTNPTQHFWTSSPKAYGHLMIDDSAVGTPLTYDNTISDRPFVDWMEIEKLLIKMGIL